MYVNIFVGERLNSELSLEDMWDKIEAYGIDRKILEETDPSNELLFQLYTAITKVNEQMHELNNKDTF
jgi:hypothetical protein